MIGKAFSLAYEGLFMAYAYKMLLLSNLTKYVYIYKEGKNRVW